VYGPEESLPFLVEAVFPGREGLEAEAAPTGSVWPTDPGLSLFVVVLELLIGFCRDLRGNGRCWC
jgi:hypothetical protein